MSVKQIQFPSELHHKIRDMAFQNKVCKRAIFKYFRIFIIFIYYFY